MADTDKMAEMTRKEAATTDERTPEGADSFESGSGDGERSLNAKMAEQAHQPDQGDGSRVFDK